MKKTNALKVSHRKYGVISGKSRKSEESEMDKYAQMRQKKVKGKVKEK